MINANRNHDPAFALFHEVCKGVGSQYAMMLSSVLASDGMEAAFALPFHPSAYSNPSTFALDYLCHTYLKKYEGGPSGVSAKKLRVEAVASFKETEARMALVNRKLRYRSANHGVDGIISIARRKILDILTCGNSLESNAGFSTSEFLGNCDWGNGATASLKASSATIDKKILEPKLGVTHRALKYAKAYLENEPGWLSARIKMQVGDPSDVSFLPGFWESQFDLTHDGRFETVPKSWKSLRGIDIQPTLNLFLQKGIGKMLRKRLRRDGINLDDQSRNQELARIAHSSSLATIDLKAASDSVSTELVMLLLPEEWYEVLWDLRTHRIKLDNESHYVHKFSAMGNGYTFELESLIFYALSWAVVRVEGNDQKSQIAVYGDDIVVHQNHAERLIQVLAECGFETNVDKTFVSGRFFESCGKHFFDGVDVTPIYQKEAVNSLPSAISAANRLFRWALRSGDYLLVDGTVRVAHDLAVQLVMGFNKTFSRRKASARSLPLPIIPYTDPSDTGLIVLDFFERKFERGVFEYDQHGIYWVPAVRFDPNRVRGDDYALFSNSLRKGVVTETPSCGLVMPRGEGIYIRWTRRMYLVNVWAPVWSN